MGTKEKVKDALYTVYLEKGESFTTPWGKKLFKKKPVDIHSSDPHIAYYRGNTRFRVEEQRKRASLPERNRVMSRRRKEALVSEQTNKAEEREATAARAKELGIKLTKNDTVESVQKKIAAAEKEAARGKDKESGSTAG